MGVCHKSGLLLNADDGNMKNQKQSRKITNSYTI